MVFLCLFCFIFTSAHFATTRKKICHVHVHAILSGLFYVTCANFASLVVLTLLGGAEHTRVNWDLASVTCLGIFACRLMSETHYN